DTERVGPVTKPASSEARKTTAGAMSSGVPSRPHGITRLRLSASLGLSATNSRWNSGVSDGPGQTQFTLTLWRATSRAIVLVNATPPPFSIPRATSVPPASFRSAIATRAPSRASALAIARPMPLAPPVTIATRSRSFTGFPGGRSSPRVTPLGLHGLPVDHALRGAREGVGERHGMRPLEAVDVPRHEVAHLLGGLPAVRDLDHVLERLAPLGVGDAVHAHPVHARELHDHRLDLRRVDVLPAGLDQLLLRLALDVVEVAVGVEPPHVPGVVPAVAEGVGRHVRL